MPQPLSGLNRNEAALFSESLLRVSELEGTLAERDAQALLDFLRTL